MNMAQLVSRFLALEERVKRLWINPWQGGGGKFYAGTLLDGTNAGQLIASGPAVYGVIKATSSTIATYPYAETPTSTGTLPNGLGRGVYRAPGSTTDVPCFVVCDQLSTMSGGLIQGTVFLSQAIGNLPSDTGASPPQPFIRAGA